MDWEIGEIRQVNDEWYQCLESNNYRCDYCELDEVVDCCKIACMSNERIDNKDVCFKKLEKVGKLYNDCGTILQRFKIYTNVTNADTKGLELHIYSNNTIGIEVKQTKETKEDIEEKKLIELLSEKVHNAWMKEKEAQGFSYGKKYDGEKKKHPDMLPYNELKEDVKKYDRATVRAVLQAQKELSVDANKLSFKEFNLEAAKAGKPVCTRDGRSVRIICFDAKGDKPIIALIEMGVAETPNNYPIDGKAIPTKETPCDLMMLPEKKSGWIKVKKDVNLYDTKEEADRKMIGNTDYVSAKVEWEE